MAAEAMAEARGKAVSRPLTSGLAARPVPINIMVIMAAATITATRIVPENPTAYL